MQHSLPPLPYHAHRYASGKMIKITFISVTINANFSSENYTFSALMFRHVIR